MTVPAKIRRLSMLALTLLLTGALTACDNPVEEDEEHTIGLVVLRGEQEIARINIEATPAVTGRIRVAPNATETFRVVGLLEGGGQIQIEGEYGLAVVVADPGVATAVVQGTNQIVVTGNAQGTTALDLTLLHAGHPDFNRAIPLVVE